MLPEQENYKILKSYILLVILIDFIKSKPVKKMKKKRLIRRNFILIVREALQCRNGARGMLHIYQLSLLFKEREDSKSYHVFDSRKAI